MVAPILTAKLYVPLPRSRIVLRPRLIERLNEGLGHKLILVSAPAGFGKTTLVSEWVATLPAPGESLGVGAAWLSLDEGDNDPIHFISYLIAALQTLKAGIGESLLTALQSRQPPSTEAILTALLNEITTSLNEFLFVLDDYHVIESKSVDEILSFLVEHQPPQMRVIIATREDPSLPLARLRVRRQLTELRATDLQFTPAEASEFLNRVMGLNLSIDDIAALEARTEGWIAGLQLAALSMQGHHDAATFIKSFTGSHRFVLDYLIEEVLGQQSEQIQSFLLRTSILERMCGPLCDAVLGKDEKVINSESSSFILHPSSFVLEQLERANLFIVPLDNERRWYRYHHLFGDLLRQRLGQSSELPDYHLRASAWYETNDGLPEAFHHALAAGDFERAARLTEAAWQGMERNFQTFAWLGWVKKLPDAAICSRPWLCVQIGWAYSDVGEAELSESYLKNAERAVAGLGEQEAFKSIPGNIALIRAGNYQIEGNLSETVRYAELSIQLIPEDELLIRAQAAITLGFTHWATGNVEASLQALHTWREDMQKMGNPMYVIASAFAVSDMQVILGHLGEAKNVLLQTIQQAAALGQEAEVVTAHHHLGLAMIAHERGDEIAFTQSMQTAADLGQHTTLIDWTHRWNLAQARLKESDGEFDSALQYLDDAESGYVKNPIPMFQPVEARKARIYLKQGRLEKAQAWVRERSLSVRDEADYLGEYEHLTLARIQLAEHSFDGVGQLLERFLALAESQKRMGSVIEILLTQALVHQAQGEHPQSLAALERALTLAEPEGYIRIFVDEGKPMAGLLARINPKNGTPRMKEYVHKLLSAFDNTKDLYPSSFNLQPLVEPLSERELEVLKLLRSELSGPEIAERLIVSLNTLRTHTKNIFNKLGVNNRRAAVRRAEELDLF